MKTITYIKEMTLSQFIERAKENDLRDFTTRSKAGKMIGVDKDGNFQVEDDIFMFHRSALFPVEIKREINEDTELENLVEVNNLGISTYQDKASITSVKGSHSESFYITVNGRMSLIWTKQKGLLSDQMIREDFDNEF